VKKGKLIANILLGIILSVLAAVLVMAMVHHPEGMVTEKKYRCSGVDTYFTLVIGGSACCVNYDVWKANEVGQPYKGKP